MVTIDELEAIAERIAAMEAGQTIRQRTPGGRLHVYELEEKPRRKGATHVFVAAARRICYYGQPGRQYWKGRRFLVLTPYRRPEVIARPEECPPRAG